VEGPGTEDDTTSLAAALFGLAGFESLSAEPTGSTSATRAWRAALTTASLDPFRGSATALSSQLPAAVRVLGPFHVVGFGLAAVDDVRGRVQRDTTGHSGRSGGPLFGVRGGLRRRRDRLWTQARVRLPAGLIAGEPDGEVTLAWTVAHDPMDLYRLDDPDLARTRAAALITDLRDCPIGELARLGRTLHTWQVEPCAHFDHPDVSNGQTENPHLDIKNNERIAAATAHFDQDQL
jgi:transposase